MHAYVAVEHTECVVCVCVGGWVGLWCRWAATYNPRRPTQAHATHASLGGPRQAHVHIMSDFRGHGMISAAFEGETYPDAHMPMYAQHKQPCHSTRFVFDISACVADPFHNFRLPRPRPDFGRVGRQKRTQARTQPRVHHATRPIRPKRTVLEIIVCVADVSFSTMFDQNSAASRFIPSGSFQTVPPACKIGVPPHMALLGKGRRADPKGFLFFC